LLLSNAALRFFLAQQAGFDLNKAKIKPQPPEYGPRVSFLRGEATHKTNKTPTENSGRFDKIKYLMVE
jgi:hypothetical protein